MATTVGDILRAALRKIKVLAAGEPIPADDGQDALEAFTLMVDSWTNEKLLIPIVNTVSFELIPGQPEYTIGVYPTGSPPTNHIETARPEEILAGYLRDAYSTDYMLEQMTVQTWSRISRKATLSRPSRIYMQQGWPLNTIYFDSAPDVNDTLYLKVIQPLAGILSTATLVTEIDLPPGYKRALIYALAIDLAEEWGKQVSPLLLNMAVDAKRWLKRTNWRSLVLKTDRAIATQRRGMGTYIIEQGP